MLVLSLLVPIFLCELTSTSWSSDGNNILPSEAKIFNAKDASTYFKMEKNGAFSLYVGNRNYGSTKQFGNGAPGLYQSTLQEEQNRT